MRSGIHPNYHVAKVVCACGASWETGSTANEIHVDICSACHPFYTGKQKLMDTEGRIERFNRKYKRDSAAPASAKDAKMIREVEPEKKADKDAGKAAEPAKA